MIQFSKFFFFIVVSVSGKFSSLQNHVTPKCFLSLGVISKHTLLRSANYRTWPDMPDILLGMAAIKGCLLFARLTAAQDLLRLQISSAADSSNAMLQNNVIPFCLGSDT